uniref:RING-type domain-containing protein n=1 Tax=Bionectria ochroleuca TaxID=29856 RepID=A0A8H7N1T6_BIOOC
MGLNPNSLPGANSSSNSGDQQGNNGSSTGLLPIFIIAGVIVLLLLVCFLCAITRCPADCVESDDVESTAGVASADLKPSLETLDREAPAKDFAQVKEEAKQRKPGDQPAWPESYYACAICLDPLKAEQRVRRLCCGHVFHSSCIVPWYLRKHYFCPLCTLPYIPEEFEKSDSTQ